MAMLLPGIELLAVSQVTSSAIQHHGSHIGIVISKILLILLMWLRLSGQQTRKALQSIYHLQSILLISLLVDS